jgi:hypothetical protein
MSELPRAHTEYIKLGAKVKSVQTNIPVQEKEKKNQHLIKQNKVAGATGHCSEE